MARLLISTDLDGTLLDHHTYSPAPADRLFAILDKLDIPWVLNTSKTFAELVSLRQALGNSHPFVVENGCAIYVPQTSDIARDLKLPTFGDYRVKRLGVERQTLLDALNKLQTQFEFKGFSDMSVDEVIDLTGLKLSDAKSAMERQFTEPLLWKDSEIALTAFTQLLDQQGLKVVRGGRFVHLMGKSDKAQAQQWLAQQYQALWKEPVEVMALGDGENDSAMISAALLPVQIRSPSHDFPTLDPKVHAYQTQGVGPAGWYEAVSQVLKERYSIYNL